MKRTFTVRNLLAIVAVIALGLGSMRVGSDLLAEAVLTLTCVVLLVGLVTAIVRKTPARVGFAVFSWGYFGLINAWIPNINTVGTDLTQKAITALADKLHDQDLPEVPLPKVNENYLAEYRKLPNSKNEDLEIPFDSLDTSMLNPKEIESMRRYQEAVRARRERAESLHDKNKNARFLGTSWMTVVFGFLGSSLGRFLGPEPPPRE